MSLTLFARVGMTLKYRPMAVLPRCMQRTILLL